MTIGNIRFVRQMFETIPVREIIRIPGVAYYLHIRTSSKIIDFFAAAASSTSTIPGSKQSMN